MKDYNTEEERSQEIRILQKCAIKKAENKRIISWLESIREFDRAKRIEECGTYLGITSIDGIAKIVKANFCRERLCCICAWRRQSKFVAQMIPIINNLKGKGYRFIEVVLTVQNPPYNQLRSVIDNMIKGYKKILDTRKIKRAWKGMTRSLEITYNEKTDTYHPHIHMLICVDGDYFEDENKYVTFEEIQKIWEEKLNLPYKPNVYIKQIDNEEVGAIENLKYSLKPSKYEEALKAFHMLLKGRRLISFSGIFSKMRKELNYSSIDELIETDEIKNKEKISYNLYKFDVSGGVFNFYERYTL